MDQVTDIYGRLYKVQEERQTPYGWPVLLGRAVGIRCGATVILTQELKEHIAARALERGSLSDLGISAQTIARLRRECGLAYHELQSQWWNDRLDDLSELTGREFADKHGVYESQVSSWHTRLLGQRQQRLPDGWLQRPDVREALLSNRPLRIVAAELGIGDTTAFAMRHKLRGNV